MDGSQLRAIYLDDWAGSAYIWPTGVLTNLLDLIVNPSFFVGWPSFDQDGAYVGPLPPRSSRSAGVIGKLPSGAWATGKSSSYPTKFGYVLGSCSSDLMAERPIPEAGWYSRVGS